LEEGLNMSDLWGWGDPNPTFEGYVRSHFKHPWETFEAFDPRTPWQDQETIDARTEMLIYRSIDTTATLATMGFMATKIGIYDASHLALYRMFVHYPTVALPGQLMATGVLGIAALQTVAMQEFTPQEQLAVLSGVPQPGSSQKQKLMTLSGL